MKLTETGYNFAKMISASALLTATKPNGQVNTMTVSWGGTGILWGREVCFVFVRPERYTFDFCNEGDIMSLSFFGKERGDTLSFCGTKSGRDVDKLAHCELKYSTVNGAVVYDDATVTITMKKLYAQDLDKDCFCSRVAEPFYQNGGYHRMFICQVLDVLASN